MFTKIIRSTLPFAGSLGLSAGVLAQTTTPSTLPTTTIANTIPAEFAQTKAPQITQAIEEKKNEALDEIESRAANYVKTGLEWGTVLGLTSAALTYFLLRRQVEIQEVSLGVSDLPPRPHHPDKESNGTKFAYATCDLLEPGVMFKYHAGVKVKFYLSVLLNELTRFLTENRIAEKVYPLLPFSSGKRARRGDDFTQVFFTSNINGESLILNRLRTNISASINDNQHLFTATENANQRALDLFLENRHSSSLRTEAMLEQVRRVNVEKLFVVGFNQMDLKKLRVQIFPLTDIVHMLTRLGEWRAALDHVNPGDRRPLEKKFVRNIETACLLLSQYPDYLLYLSPTLRDFPNFMQEYNNACTIAESLIRLGPLDEPEGLALINVYIANPSEAQLIMTPAEQKRLDKKMFGTKDHTLAMERRENRREIHRGKRSVESFRPEELPKIFVRSVDMPS